MYSNLHTWTDVTHFRIHIYKILIHFYAYACVLVCPTHHTLNLRADSPASALHPARGAARHAASRSRWSCIGFTSLAWCWCSPSVVAACQPKEPRCRSGTARPGTSTTDATRTPNLTPCRCRGEGVHMRPTTGCRSGMSVLIPSASPRLSTAFLPGSPRPGPATAAHISSHQPPSPPRPQSRLQMGCGGVGHACPVGIVLGFHYCVGQERGGLMDT